MVWRDIINKMLFRSFKSDINQKRELLNNSSLIAACFCLLLTGLGYYIDYKLSLLVMPLGALVCIFLYKAKKTEENINIYGNSLVLTGSIIIIVMVTFSGGIYSPVAPWIAAGPTYALLLVNRVSAWRWTAVMIVTLGVFMLIELYCLTPEIHYDLSLKAPYYTIVFISLIMIILFINIVFESNKIDALEVVEEKNLVISQKNQDITDSINYAKNIQNAILPGNHKIQQYIPKCEIWFQPKDIVSGDFYWFANNNGYSFIAAVDCTGHGVPGAFMSMIGSQLLSKVIYEKNLVEVDEILNQLHHELNKVLQTQDQTVKDGMDLSLCRIQDNNQEVYFAGAKNDMLIVNNDQVRVIKADRQSIGGDNETRTFTKTLVNKQDGDHFFLLTDGLQDQFGGPKDKKFKIKRIKSELCLLDSSLSTKINRLQNACQVWKGNREQTDDILVIGFKLS